MLLPAIAAVAALAVAAGGCGASRRAPRPYPGGPRIPEVERPAIAIEAKADAIAELALSFQGAPYEDGGTGPSGFDCSGLVQYVFASAGVALPRSVRGQLAVGAGVEGEVRPGDLVFFAIDGEHVSHVGIATGPGSFVHAPSSRGVVRVERLDAAYWAPRLAGVRRIVGVEGERKPGPVR